MSRYFQVTSLDPDAIKESLIEFLSEPGRFEEFDYEGSAINTIVDTLVFNSHRESFKANMVSNESFLDSSQIRGNVGAHSQKLSYVPRSRTAARLVCDVTVIAGSSITSPSIKCDKGSTFIQAVDGITYTFTNRDDFLLFNGSGQTYYATDVELMQGQLVSNQFIYDPTNTRKIIIPNRDIDTSTIRVYVKDTPNSTARTEYLLVEDITDISTDSTVFYLGMNRNEEYHIQFGDGVLGREPEINSFIEIEYVAVEENHGNKISTLVAGSTIENQSNISIDVTTPAYGGKDLPTLEEIKFIAPRAYQSQNRAVRENDYEVEVLKRFPFIKAARSWGGEKNDPPAYGVVFVSLIPDEGIVLTDYVKRQIESSLDSINVGSITPRITDPEYIDIFISYKLKIDQTKTNKTFSQISSDVEGYIDMYADELLNFGRYYNDSYLVDITRERSPEIESLEFNKTVRKVFTTNPNTPTTYTTKFRNPVRKGTISVDDFSTNSAASEELIYDVDGDIIHDRIVSGNTLSNTIGTVDYETGEISFSLTTLTTTNMKVWAEPITDNFYAQLETVLRLNAGDSQEITEG